jgi:cytochrome c biogenesis protein
MLKKIYHLLGSLGFALILFALIALTSSVGTFIKQHAPEEETLSRLSGIFGDSAPTVYNILNTTGFTDLYHTYWFNSLLLLLAVNLIACSLIKLPATWKRLTGVISTDELVYSTRFNIQSEVDVTKPEVEKAFQNTFKNWKTVENSQVLAAEKGRFSKSGALITHAGLVVILIGGFIGGIFGFKGNIAVLEGHTENILVLPKEGEMELPFNIYLQDFQAEFYENTSRQSAFRSKIHFIQDNVTTEAVVAVNQPVTYGGLKFYQSSYGIYPNRDVMFKLRVGSATNDNITEHALKIGEVFEIPELNITGMVNDFAPALGHDDNGNMINISTDFINPAINIIFTDSDGDYASEWIWMKDPASGNFLTTNVSFVDVWGAEYTVLTAKKDPGIFVIYLGLIILSLGVSIALLSSHRRVWVTVSDNDGKSTIKLFYDKDKGSVSAEQEAKKLLRQLVSSFENKGGK